MMMNKGEIKMRETEVKYDLTNAVKKVTLKDRLSKVFKVDKKNIWGIVFPILLILKKYCSSLIILYNSIPNLVLFPL